MNDTELQRYIVNARRLRARELARLGTRLFGLPGRLLARLPGGRTRQTADATTAA